jgi:hypothetical protein
MEISRALGSKSEFESANRWLLSMACAIATITIANLKYPWKLLCNTPPGEAVRQLRRAPGCICTFHIRRAHWLIGSCAGSS